MSIILQFLFQLNYLKLVQHNNVIFAHFISQFEILPIYKRHIYGLHIHAYNTYVCQSCEGSTHRWRRSWPQGIIKPKVSLSKSITYKFIQHINKAYSCMHKHHIILKCTIKNQWFPW